MCKGENFIQLIFGHDLFHLQLMKIDAFISVYFAHCSFLFCLWISTEAKTKLGIDETQTVKVKMSERNRNRGSGGEAFAKICCSTPLGISRLL